MICDVPCSGLGVLRKKPEIRYKKIEDIGAIPSLQKEILSAAARYLKVGGRLLYATCTILKEENQKVVADFLATHPNFTSVPFCVGEHRAEEGMMTLFPHIHGTDGFFVAILEKTHS